MISTSSITDRHLHSSSIFMTIQTTNMSYQPHLSPLKTRHHHSHLCLEDHRLCASPPYNSDTARRPHGVGGTQRRYWQLSSWQTLVKKYRHRSRLKTDLGCLW